MFREERALRVNACWNATRCGGLDAILDGYEPDAPLRAGIEQRLDFYMLVERTTLLRWLHERGGKRMASTVQWLREMIPSRVRALRRE